MVPFKVAQTLRDLILPIWDLIHAALQINWGFQEGLANSEDPPITSPRAILTLTFDVTRKNRLRNAVFFNRI
jgi:hypothetical protein